MTALRLLFVLMFSTAPQPLSAEEEMQVLPELWRYATGGRITGIELGMNGTVYAASEDRYLYVFDQSGGMIRREQLVDKPVSDISFLVDGSLCLPLRRGITLLTNEGKTVWHRRISAEPVGKAGSDRYGYIYAAVRDGRVLSFTHTGRLRWETKTGRSLTSGFAFDGGSGRGIAASGDEVFCLRFTGEEVWRTVISGYSFFDIAVIDQGVFALAAPEGIVLVDSEGTVLQKIAFSAARNIKGLLPLGPGKFLVYSGSGFIWEFRKSGEYISGRGWFLADAAEIADLTVRGGSCYIGTARWLVHGYTVPVSGPAEDSAPGYDIYEDIPDTTDFYILRYLKGTMDRGNIVRVLDEIEAHADRPPARMEPAYLFILDSIINQRSAEAPPGEAGHGWDHVIRSRALMLLGRLGNFETIRHIRNAGLHEYNPGVIQPCIRALGLLGSDPEGKSVSLIADLVRRNERLLNDPGIAVEAADALEKLQEYQNLKDHDEFVRTLLSIFSGNYPREVRQKALQILEKTQ